MSTFLPRLREVFPYAERRWFPFYCHYRDDLKPHWFVAYDEESQAVLATFQHNRKRPSDVRHIAMTLSDVPRFDRIVVARDPEVCGGWLRMAWKTVGLSLIEDWQVPTAVSDRTCWLRKVPESILALASRCHHPWPVWGIEGSVTVTLKPGQVLGAVRGAWERNREEPKNGELLDVIAGYNYPETVFDPSLNQYLKKKVAPVLKRASELATLKNFGQPRPWHNDADCEWVLRVAERNEPAVQAWGSPSLKSRHGEMLRWLRERIGR